MTLLPKPRRRTECACIMQPSATWRVKGDRTRHLCIRCGIYEPNGIDRVDAGLSVWARVCHNCGTRVASPDNSVLQFWHFNELPPFETNAGLQSHFPNSVNDSRVRATTGLYRGWHRKSLARFQFPQPLSRGEPCSPDARVPPSAVGWRGPAMLSSKAVPGSRAKARAPSR